MRDWTYFKRTLSIWNAFLFLLEYHCNSKQVCKHLVGSWERGAGCGIRDAGCEMHMGHRGGRVEGASWGAHCWNLWSSSEPISINSPIINSHVLSAKEQAGIQRPNCIFLHVVYWEKKTSPTILIWSLFSTATATSFSNCRSLTNTGH